jgi:hypothetical protein
MVSSKLESRCQREVEITQLFGCLVTTLIKLVGQHLARWISPKSVEMSQQLLPLQLITQLAMHQIAAAATINTYLAATEAYKVAAAVLGPIGGAAAAGLAIAAGLKNVQKIMAVQPPQPKFAMGGIVPGYGYGTEDNITAMVSPGEAVMAKGAVDLFSPILSLMNQAGGGRSFSGGVVSTGADAAQVELINSVKAQNRKPVQAYVVSTQMENQMMLDRATKSRSLI